MDGVVICVAILVWYFMHLPTKETQEAVVVSTVPTIQLNPHLNPSMYHDEQAFMLIANELGFH